MSDNPIRGSLRSDILNAYLDVDKFSAEDIAHLKQIHDPRVVDAFVAALADDSLSPREKAPLRRLGVSGRDLKGWKRPWQEWVAGQPVPAEVGARLSHPDPAVREAALEEYGRGVRVPADLTLVIEKLGDPDARVRANAAGHLGYFFGNLSGLSKLGLMEASPPEGVTGEEYSRSFLAVRAQALAGLMERLQTDPDSVVRARAAGSLGGFHDESTVPALLAALSDPSDVAETISTGWVDSSTLGYHETAVRIEIETNGVCKAAIKALGRIGSAQAVPALRERLADDDPGVRALAAEVLGDLKAVEAVPDLIGLVHDPDAKVRYQALNALIYIDPPDLLGVYRGAFEDPDVDVKLLAALGLVRQAGAENSARLIDFLSPFLGTAETQGPTRQGIAYNALLTLGRPAVPALRAALESADERVRFDAALILSDMHEETGLNDRTLQDKVIAEMRAFQTRHPESFANLTIPQRIAELEK